MKETDINKWTTLMIEKMQSLTKDWQKPWFSASAMKYPRNMNGRRYNGMNSVMLMLLCEKNGYDKPVFCTFDRVAGLNFSTGKDGKKQPLVNENGEKLPIVCINKGEKSFPVFITTFTVVDKDTKERIKYDDYKQMDSEQQKQYQVYPKLQVFNVFNIDQTNIKEARPELYNKIERELAGPNMETNKDAMFHFAPVDVMVERNGWVCPIFLEKGDSAYYAINKDEIHVPLPELFKDGESYVGTLLHEAAHSLGAEGRFDRIKGGFIAGSPEYAKEELVAELTSALVCSQYGMTKNLKCDSAAYLKAWIDTLHEKPDFIKTVLLDVKKSAAVMTQRIDGIQERLDKGLDPFPEQAEGRHWDIRNDSTRTMSIQESINKSVISETKEEVHEENHYHFRR